MKARVKILVNGIAGTVLTGAIAAGLVLSSSGAFQAEDSLSANEWETVTDSGEENDALANVISGNRFQLGRLWDIGPDVTEASDEETQEDTVGSVQEKETDDAAIRVKAVSSDPLAVFFEDKGLVDPDSIATCLNIRSAADENAGIVSTISGNTLVNLLETSGEWSQIETQGLTGWVKTEFLHIGADAADYVREHGDTYARVIKPNMNMRLRASTQSDILAVAYEGDLFEIRYAENDWVYVTYEEDIRGYLSGDCVNISYYLGENWIHTDIAVSAGSAALLRLPIHEGSADTFDWEPDGVQTLDSGYPEAESSQTAAGEPGSESIPTSDMTAVTEPEGQIQPSEAQTASAEESQTKAEQEEEIPPRTSAQPEEETPPQTTAAVLTAIEAFYRGGSKTEGEVVSRSEVYIIAGYSDGTFQTIEEGWTSDDIGMMLHAGDNVLQISYGGFTSAIVLSAAASSPDTQPSGPEEQPTAPDAQPSGSEAEPIPTEPTTPTPTEPTTPTPTEPTTPTPTEPATPAPTEPEKVYSVTNVPLSSDLIAYTLDLCGQYGVDYSVIFSVMYQESRFNPNATSGSGAVGLMQIIPRYSQERMARLGVSNLYDPASNILVGIDILAEYYHTYGSWTQALTRYRTGNPNGSADYANLILSCVGMFQLC